MIWDKVFWLWFIIMAVFVISLIMEDASTTNLAWGSMLIGLGLVKMAGERSAGGRGISRRLLERIRK